MRVFAVFLLLWIGSLCFGGCALIPQAGSAVATGTWRVESPASYLVEKSPHKPHGDEVHHESLDLVERSAHLEWELVERPDGLITGTNRWISYDRSGKELFRGTEALLGAHDGLRLVLEEAPDEQAHTPQIVFDCTFDGRDRIRGIGYEVGSKELMVMRFVLVRVGDGG